MTYLRHLIKLALETGDAFSANQRSSFHFYGGSYNATLKDICENIFINKEGEIYYELS